MCELFGINSKEKQTINNYLNTFYSHCNTNPHGWGIAIINKNKNKIIKEPIKANQSTQLKKLLQKPIQVKNTIAHIRLGTIGQMKKQNCHPIIKKDKNQETWILAHNGTIFNNYPPLNTYKKNQQGTTDSERILYYIVDTINQKTKQKGKPLNQNEKFQTLNKLITQIAPENKLNLLIYNKNILYAHTNYKNSLHYLKKDKTILISTVPLTMDNWKKLPLNTLIAMKEGEIIKKGEQHKNEYIETKRDQEFLKNCVPQIIK